MIEFEVMVRPVKALTTLGEETGNRIGPQLSPLKQAAGAPMLTVALLMASPQARACAGGGLVARIGAPWSGLFWPILLSGHAAVAQW